MIRPLDERLPHNTLVLGVEDTEAPPGLSTGCIGADRAGPEQLARRGENNCGAGPGRCRHLLTTAEWGTASWPSATPKRGGCSTNDGVSLERDGRGGLRLAAERSSCTSDLEVKSGMRLRPPTPTRKSSKRHRWRNSRHHPDRALP